MSMYMYTVVTAKLYIQRKLSAFYVVCTAALRDERALGRLLGGIDFERFEKRRDLLRKPQAGLDHFVFRTE